MNRILMVSIAVTASAMIGVSETAQAQHHRGCHYGGGYSYAVPVYSYAPAYSYAPRYRSAYVQPAYGVSIGFGQNYHGGNGRYFSGHGGYHRGQNWNRGGNGGHYRGHGGHYRGHHH